MLYEDQEMNIDDLRHCYHLIDLEDRMTIYATILTTSEIEELKDIIDQVKAINVGCWDCEMIINELEEKLENVKIYREEDLEGVYI